MCSKCGNSDIGLLLIRIAVAAVFLAFGWMKISNMSGTIGFFGQLGLGAFWAYVATAVELLGGIAVLLGVFMVPATILLAIIMVVAVVVATGKGGFGMYYSNVLLFLTLIGLAMTGPGKYSISAKCPCQKDGMPANGGSVEVPKM